MKKEKSVPDVCHKLIRRSKGYVVVAIDGADNIKVAGDVSKMGKPCNELQEMFSALVTHVYNGGALARQMAQARVDFENQSVAVQGAKKSRSEELGRYGDGAVESDK